MSYTSVIELIGVATRDSCKYGRRTQSPGGSDCLSAGMHCCVTHLEAGSGDPFVSFVERFNVKFKEYHERDWRHAPHFVTPLKNHAVCQGQDCTMSCAFVGIPRPVVTLYKGNVNITANSKFWYNSTSGVCTLMIPTCSSKDSGDYTVAIENELGQEKCSCMLTVYGE